jgi:hypothetical protein
MSYNDWLAQQSQPNEVAQQNMDARYAAANTGGNDVGNALNSMFGAAQNIYPGGPDYSASLYGGSPTASQSNQDMLRNFGNTNEQTATNYGSGIGRVQDTRAAQFGGQAAQVGQAGQGASAGGQGIEQQSSNQLGNWLQQGPGPSVAQAQLRQQNNTNVANAMALASSGRGQGGGAAAQQQAAFQGANMGQQTNQQAAILRAQEAQNWRQQQLQGMGTQANIGAGLAQQGQGQQQLGLGYSQLGEQAQQSGNAAQLNALGMGQQNQLAYMNLGQQQLANEQQGLTQQQVAAMNIKEQAEQANQQSFYQHQSGVTGMLSAAAGALAFL